MYGTFEVILNGLPLPEMSITSPFLCVTQEEDTGLGNRATGSGQHHSVHLQPIISQWFLQLQEASQVYARWGY